jgi:hypothetical protein
LIPQGIFYPPGQGKIVFDQSDAHRHNSIYDRFPTGFPPRLPIKPL